MLDLVVVSKSLEKNIKELIIDSQLEWSPFSQYKGKRKYSDHYAMRLMLHKLPTIDIKEKSGKNPAVEETSGDVQIVSDSSDDDVPMLDPVPTKNMEDNRSRASESSGKSRRSRVSRSSTPADYSYMDEEENQPRHDQQEEDVVIIEPAPSAKPPHATPKRKVELKPNARAFRPIDPRAPPVSHSPNYEKASHDLYVLTEQVRLLTQQAQQNQHYYPHGYYSQQHTAPFNQFHS